MTPYIVLAVLVCLLACLGDFVHKGAGRWRAGVGATIPNQRLSTSYFDLLAVAALVCFAGLRYEVGTDYVTYVSIFNALSLSDWGTELGESPQEFGFTALMLAAKALTGTPRTVFWLAAVLTVVPTYAVLKRYSALPAFSVALFVLMTYATSFNVVRQAVAVALMFWAWSFLGRKTRWFLVLSALSAAIHISAVFAALAFVLARRWRFNVRAAGIVAAAAVAVAILAERTPIVSSFLEVFNPRYGGYLQSNETGLGAYLMIAAFVVLLVFSVYVGSRESPMTDQDHQFAVYLLIGLAFMVAGTQAGVVFRMGFYFLPFALLLVPNRIARTKDSALSGALILAGASAYYVAHLANFGDVVPYQTYVTF